MERSESETGRTLRVATVSEQPSAVRAARVIERPLTTPHVEDHPSAINRYNPDVRRSTLALLVALQFLAFGQSPKPVPSTPEPLQLVTVCEVLKNLQQFNGKDVAVIGRFDATDEGFWLSEDECGQKFTTGDRTWPNSIWIECCHSDEPGRSKPPVFGKEELNNKLQQLRTTTALGRRPYFVTTWSGKLKWVTQDDRWLIAIGRIEGRDHYERFQGPSDVWNGFGHLAAAPIQIVWFSGWGRQIPDPKHVVRSKQQE